MRREGVAWRSREGRTVHLAVAVEILQQGRTGLGHFVPIALRHLREARPEWRITVMGDSRFAELAALSGPNLTVKAWNEQPLLRGTAWLLRRLFPHANSQGIGDVAARIWSHAPLSSLRRGGGDLPSLWQGLEGVDVIWVPFHPLGQARFSPRNNLRGLACPTLVTIHDMHPLHYPQDWSEDSLRLFQDDFCAFAEECAALITHSQFQRQIILSHLRVLADKVSVVPIPPLLQAEVLTSPPSPEQIARVLELLGIREPFIFYPASQTASHKNHVRLLLAWARLRQELGEECPLLVGTQAQPHQAALLALQEALGIQDRVLFAGPVDDSTLAVLYHACQQVIVPTLYEGGGSGPVAEALLAGRPVLCSDIAPIREQMAAYGTEEDVTWFGPLQVEDIADAVLAQRGRFQAGPNLGAQQRLLEAEPRLWARWAEFYAQRLEQVARGHRQS
jgi:glycosyltransferase involved in cell wall biosynthesis